MSDWVGLGLSGSHPAQLMAAIVRRFSGLSVKFEGYNLHRFDFARFGNASSLPTVTSSSNAADPVFQVQELVVAEDKREFLSDAFISAQNLVKKSLVHVIVQREGRTLLSSYDNWDRGGGVHLYTPAGDDFPQWLVAEGIVRRTYVHLDDKPPLHASYKKRKGRLAEPPPEAIDRLF